MKDTKILISHGLHKNRLHADRDNQLEVAFVEQWKKENRFSDMLEKMMWVYCDKDDSDFQRISQYGKMKQPIGPPTKRDRILVETLIQWLGSNVGFSFLQGALWRAGYVITDRIERVDPKLKTI